MSLCEWLFGCFAVTQRN